MAIKTVDHVQVGENHYMDMSKPGKYGIKYTVKAERDPHWYDRDFDSDGLTHCLSLCVYGTLLAIPFRARVRTGCRANTPLSWLL